MFTWRASETPLAEGAVDLDSVQCALEDRELLGLESRREVLGDAAGMNRCRLCQAPNAGCGQRDHHAAPVGIGVGSSNQAFTDQSRDPAGHP